MRELTGMGVKATTLTPFYYHGLYSPDGSATDPGILTDTTVMFALAHALGCPPTPFRRSRPDYATDIVRLPWKASMFLASADIYSSANHLLKPVRRGVDVEREGGYHETLQKNMGSGNVKKVWWVHEVGIGATYYGALFGPNPFKLYSTSEIFVRVGVGSTGLVRLEPTALPDDSVRLNTATVKLFGDSVPEDYRILDTIRVSVPLDMAAAGKVVSEWSVQR